MTPRASSARPSQPLAEAACAYARAGFAVFPCKARGKLPLLSKAMGGSGHLDATMDEAVVAKWWASNPNANIGIVPGKSRHIVLDIDGPAGEEQARALGIHDSLTRHVRTGRGRHLWFAHPGGDIGNANCLGNKIDVRADGGYVLAPPSIHPSGAVYRWMNPDAEILALPAAIATLLLEQANPRSARIMEGTRNASLARYLGGLRQRGAELDELIVAALDFNARSCDPPLEEREVLSVAASIAKYPPGVEEPSAAIDDLNKTYAIVQLGSSVRVLQETTGGVQFLRRDEFRVLLENRFVNDRGNARPATDAWLRSPHRRQFNAVVFEPGRIRSDSAYNLWRGWGVESREGDCSLFLEHLKEVVCSGDEKLFRWVLAWFSHIFTHPLQKPGTALVLRGRQGTGKSLVGKVFGRLLGRAYRNVARSRMVTGNFNQHLECCLLLHADEAFWAGDKSAEGALKDLITNDVQWIEKKGIDAIETSNPMRLFVTSNSEWVVPAGFEERRFCVIDVGEQRMQDKAFFGAMLSQLETGGYEALLHLCLTHDFSDADLRTIPITGALLEQKLSSLTPEQGWWMDVLSAGVLPGDGDGEGIAPRNVLYHDYVAHSQRAGAKWRSIETLVGLFLKKHVPNLRRFEQMDEDTGKNIGYFEFPPLKECREAFSRLMSGYSGWTEPWAWTSAGTTGVRRAQSPI